MTRASLESPPHAPPPSEFARPFRVDAWSGHDRIEKIEASRAECQALAARFGLVAVNRLRATLRLVRIGSGARAMVRVRGTLSAQVVQTCVVTLEPLVAEVEEPFGALFAPESLVAAEPEEILLDPMSLDEDLAEPMVGGAIDLGELTAQHLSLALDPYPRRPDAAFPAWIEESAGAAAEAEAQTGAPTEKQPGTDAGTGESAKAAGATSPFQVLASLQRRH